MGLKRLANHEFTIHAVCALAIGLALGCLIGCGDVKDLEGRVIIHNPPPKVEPHIDVHVGPVFPPRHHPLRPWLDEPKPKPEPKERSHE